MWGWGCLPIFNQLKMWAFTYVLLLKESLMTVQCCSFFSQQIFFLVDIQTVNGVRKFCPYTAFKANEGKNLFGGNCC